LSAWAAGIGRADAGAGVETVGAEAEEAPAGGVLGSGVGDDSADATARVGVGWSTQAAIAAAEVAAADQARNAPRETAALCVAADPERS
jgi:hypothetical protein